MSRCILKVQDLAKSYPLPGGRDVHVLERVSMAVHEGTSAAIMGVSGSGKTTLLHILAGIEDEDSGTLEITGGRAGLIFQHHYLIPELSALENVVIAARIGGTPKKQAFRRGAELLEEVGLSERAEHFPAELSGGEMARVGIARALVTDPRLILADEPTGSLDEQTKEKIQTLLFNVVENHNSALVLVTHDQAVASRADTIYHLEHGRLSSLPK